MGRDLTSILKPYADIAFKLAINFHLLLILIFSIFHTVPGAYIDDEHFVEQVKNIAPDKKKMNFFIQLKESIHDFYTLDFGNSFQNRNVRVMDLIKIKAEYSFQYLSWAVIFLFFGAILISFLVMKSKKTYFYLSFFKALNQLPQLVLIPGIVYVFAYMTSLVPLKFDPNNFRCHIFVILALVIKPLSQLVHMTVEKWQKEMMETYVYFARAKGLSRNRVLIVHTFKNVANTFLGYFLTIVLHVLTGNFILESLYSIPGFGLGFMDSVLQRDLPLVIGYIFLFSSLYLTLHFIVQIFFLYLNPRLQEVE